MFPAEWPEPALSHCRRQAIGCGLPEALVAGYCAGQGISAAFAVLYRSIYGRTRHNCD